MMKPLTAGSALSGALFAAALAGSCVDVPQQAPLTKSDFTVADFDTATGKVPFPILLPCPTAVNPQNGACPAGGTYDATRGRVALPITPCQSGQTPCISPGNPAGCTACDSVTAAISKIGLNTLDGFATYAAPRTTFDKALSTTTVSKQTAFLVDASTGQVADFRPRVETIDGVVTLLFEPDRPTSSALTTSVRPLKPETTYFAVITNNITDAQNRKIEPDRSFAFLRARTPLANDDGSAIPGSLLENARPEDFGCQGTDEQKRVCLFANRAGVERTRKSFDAIFRGLEAANPLLQRESVALLWPFRTQSTGKTFVAIRNGLLTSGAVAPAMTRPPQGAIPGSVIYPTLGGQEKVQTLQLGCLRTPILLTAGGTFGADAQGNPIVGPHYVPYALAIPKDVSPPYKVAIFGHGLGRWRFDMISVANTLATAGYATIAIDHVWHGNRSNYELGHNNDNPALCNPGAPAAQAPVLCSDPNGTYDPESMQCSAGTPVPSGSRLFNATNLLATRDNFRQAVVDLMQVVQTLKASRVNNQPEFDTHNIVYVGTSLGAILGGVFLGAEPEIKSGVLAAGGGPWTLIVSQTRPSICAPLFGALAALGICDRPDATNKPCECRVNTAFTSYIHVAQWILDSADPINFGQYQIENPLWCQGTSGPVPCSAGATPIRKKVLLQGMANDPVVPNSATYALRGAIGPQSCYREFTTGGHGFLFDPTDPSFAEAQRQMAHFLTSGGTTTRIGGSAEDACP
jgi:dienelactone hydrolase